jgi:quinol monooxygenase YgiN
LYIDFMRREQVPEKEQTTELFVFICFHAHEGKQNAVAQELLDVIGPSRAEPGCLSIGAYRSTRDPRLFFIHSQWVNEAAFEDHAVLPHTMRFIERVRLLIDHELDVVRTRSLKAPEQIGRETTDEVLRRHC